MSEAILFGSLLMGLLGLVASRVSIPRLSRIAPGVSWIGLMAGFGLQAAGQITDLRGAIGTALFAGVAVAFGGESDSRQDALGGASAVVVLGAAVAAIAVPHGDVMTAGHLILVSALFAALLAMTSGLVGAVSARMSGNPVGVALTIGGAFGGAAIAGFFRSSLPQSGYSVPLRTADGVPLFWEMPGVQGLEGGLRFNAVLDVPAMPWIVGVGISLAVLAAAFELFKQKKSSLVAWALLGGCSLGALGVLHVASTKARLPGSQRYEDQTRQVLREEKVDEALLQRASFTGGDSKVVIERADAAPELFGYGLAALLAFLALTRKTGPFARQEEDERAELLQRDLLLRAAAFGWLAILAAGLIQFGYFGAAWVGSASEWIAFGTMFVISGLAIGSFDRRPTRVANAVRAIVPGIAAALVFVVLGLAYSFATPFALSINAY